MLCTVNFWQTTINYQSILITTSFFGKASLCNCLIMLCVTHSYVMSYDIYLNKFLNGRNCCNQCSLFTCRLIYLSNKVYARNHQVHSHFQDRWKLKQLKPLHAQSATYLSLLNLLCVFCIHLFVILFFHVNYIHSYK